MCAMPVAKMESPHGYETHAVSCTYRRRPLQAIVGCHSIERIVAHLILWLSMKHSLAESTLPMFRIFHGAGSWFFFIKKIFFVKPAFPPGNLPTQSLGERRDRLPWSQSSSFTGVSQGLNNFSSYNNASWNLHRATKFVVHSIRCPRREGARRGRRLTQTRRTRKSRGWVAEENRTKDRFTGSVSS